MQKLRVRALVNVHIKDQNKESIISVTSNVAWMLVSDGLVWVFHKLLGFLHTMCLVFTQNGAKNKKDCVSDSYVGGNTLLISKAKGKWPGWFTRKDILTELATLYHCGMQKSISICTNHQTLRWMGQNSRWPHRSQEQLSSEFIIDFSEVEYTLSDYRVGGFGVEQTGIGICKWLIIEREHSCCLGSVCEYNYYK